MARSSSSVYSENVASHIDNQKDQARLQCQYIV